jgi:hypothetical protein
MASGYTCGIVVPTPAVLCAGTRMRVWGLRTAPFGGGLARRTAPIIAKGRASNWHDTC